MRLQHASQTRNSRIKWGGVPPRPDHRRCPNPGFGGPTRSETHWHQIRCGRDSGVEPLLTPGTQCQTSGPPARTGGTIKSQAKMLGDPLRAVHVHGCLHCWCPLGAVLASGHVGSRPCIVSHLHLCIKGHESRIPSLLRPNIRRLTTRARLFLPDQCRWAPRPRQVSPSWTV